ncbi:hypothetical protein [Paenibacillus polymyxa]|uniref:hypothetical protein n=1 Tax=Paenibacillus polymyxa TaxID=1406 RepID=UPI0021E3F1E4|nr:hypothetical protein [Paenibacillus polymyxa]
MKKYICMFFFLMLLLPCSFASAKTFSLDDYAYLHSNKIGISWLADKSGSTVFDADASNGNGRFVALSFRNFEGLGSEKLYVVYMDGTRQLVTDTSVSLKRKDRYLKICLEKTTLNETLIQISQFTIVDPDFSDDVIRAYKSGPEGYGSLGMGSASDSTGGGGTGAGSTGGGGTGAGSTGGGSTGGGGTGGGSTGGGSTGGGSAGGGSTVPDIGYHITLDPLFGNLQLNWQTMSPVLWFLFGTLFAGFILRLFIRKIRGDDDE